MSWLLRANILPAYGRDDMNTQFVKILSQFRDPSGLVSIEKFGSGHIHETFLAHFHNEGHDLVLQQINHHVFRNVESLMKNISIVAEFINMQLKKNPEKYPGMLSLTLIPTLNGARFHTAEDNEYWRCFLLIPGTHSYDNPPQKKLVAESGKMLGSFQAILSGLNPSQLAETIPAFHDLQKRLDTFHEILILDTANRAKDCRNEISFVMQRVAELLKLDSLVKSGAIPQRIVHNDPKFNNFLFDTNHKAVCLIDLDTVMPGTVLFDFGDAIRTAANTAAEDEPDTSAIAIDLEAYRYFTEGYLREASFFLTKTEKENLALSCRYMAFIIGLRFLSDHLDGDHYYRIHYPGHNLVRARAQFALVKSMEDNRAFMENII